MTTPRLGSATVTRSKMAKRPSSWTKARSDNLRCFVTYE